MKRSFVNPLLFYIFGILIFYFVDISFNIIVLMFLILIAYLSYDIIKGALNQSILLCFFIMLGIFVSSINTNGYLENFIDKEVYLQGQVLEVDKKTSELEKYIVKINKINNKKISKEKTILTIIGEKDLKLGSSISFKTKGKLPKGNTNPKLFNYKTYLKGKKIHTIMTVDSNLVEVDNTVKIPFKYRLKESTIRSIESLFKPYLNEENNSLITSIILGNSNYLSADNVELYRDMGLAHILAVSGLHIGIISSFIIFLISRLGIKRKANVILTLIFIWSYGFMIGYPASILRASILFSFLYLSKIIHRPYDSLNILSLAGLILLIINPYSLFLVGFQLSFIASASIIVFTERVSDLFYPLRGKFIETLSSLISVNIGLAPIQAYYFNKISVLAFIANILVLPILSFSLVLGFIMIFLNHFLPILNLPLGKLLNTSLNLQFSLLRLMERLPINTIRVFSPQIISIIFIFITLFILFGMIDIKILGKNIIRVLVVYLMFLIVFNLASIKDNIEIHFIDVGQGDSIYIKSGRKDILIDTGGSIFKNYNIPEKIVLPYLEKIGVRKLDALFISHFHEDHCQGIPLLLENFKVDHIFASHNPTDEYMSLVDDSRFKILKKGDKIKIDKDIDVEILWPIDNMDYEKNLNNKSMVGILNFKDKKVLFTGDMEKEVENQVLETMEEVDILKVAHHGSDTSSTEDFIEKIDPQISIISVGENNMYNHPSRSVLDRLDRSETLRTDRNGLIKIILDDDLEINPYLIDGEQEKATLEDYLFRNYNYFLYNTICFMSIYILVKVFLKEDLVNAI